LNLVMGVLTQAVEVETTRQQLSQHFSPLQAPIALVRIGRAPLTLASRRRPLDAVLTEDVAQD